MSSTNTSFKNLITLQIKEPLEEKKLSKEIMKIGRITDKISKEVKSQYEENPYPRWRYRNPYKQVNASHYQIINNGIKPNYIKSDISSNEIKILIAGCGTGNQILEAQKYKNAKIIAIDISSSSLSYAQRKINELGIKNVKLIEMDILDVSLLKEKFDIIECEGVLHHMDDPLKGLHSLVNILNDNGFFKIGLYSEIARQDIVKAREFIKSKDLKANENDIRVFRQSIFSRKSLEINSLLSSPDFYTLSACRDLCFHSKEHRFTILQLKKIFDSNKLNFLGFLQSQEVKNLYQNYFPEDKQQINLYNWAKFEEIHPETFRGCYQFWVCKTQN